MGKETETTSTTEGTNASTSLVPDWLENASKGLVNAAMKGVGDFTSYAGDRVAGFVPDQKTAFKGFRDLVTKAPSYLSEAVEGARDYVSAPAQTVNPRYGSAPAQNVDFWAMMDEGSPIGGMDEYMNPYSETVLQNTLQKLYDTADRANLDLKRRATSADAFGDARHGIVESDLQLNTNRAVGETSGALLKEMFDTAMGWRSSDLGRLYSTDVTNANFDEQALERLFRGDVQQGTFNEEALDRILAGSGAMLGFQGQDQNMKLQSLAALLGSGGLQQGNAQAELDAQWQEFMREQGWDAEQIRLATSVLSGVPYTRETTGTTSGETVTTQPDNSMWQLAGTLAGAAAAPFTGGASLALPALLGPGGGGGVGPTNIDPSLPWLA
ncbi:MAG: hypothetical protein ACRECF_06975 [Methyloceanibacter sp.]